MKFKGYGFVPFVVAALTLAGGLFLVNLARARELTLQGGILPRSEPVSLSGRSPTAITTTVTYQGLLQSSSAPVTDVCDFEFGLWDALSGGGQVGSSQTVSNASVTVGILTVDLNSSGEFGASAFTGEARWLEIAVRCPAGGGGYTTLTPRQPLTPAPYALFAADVQPYENVVIVAKSGGDFATIQGALDSITDNGPAQRYLVWVAPGFYTETVTMKPFVDIEGAGEGLTFISGPGSTNLNDATLIGASSTTLSHLTVENSGGSNYAVGIYASTVGFNVEHVSISVIGGTNGSYGIRHQGAGLSLQQLTINVNGDTAVGIYQDSPGGITVSDSYVRAAGGTNAWGLRHTTTNGGGFTVERSEIEAVGVNAYGVESGTAAELNVTDSEVTAVSGALPGSGTSYAISTNSVDFVTISRSMLATWNGANNRGLWVQGNPAFADSETNVIDSTIFVGDGATAYGILVMGAPMTRIAGSSINLRNGTDNRGVQIQDGSATIRGSAISVQDGSNINYGLLVVTSSGTETVTVDQATIVSDDNTILTAGAGTPDTLVGATRLDGGSVIVNAGSITCAGVYDEAFVFYANSCP
jgi:hypothetical protein